MQSPDSTLEGNRSWTALNAIQYGALGAPLAFLALPLYVQWPAFAEQSMGLTLSAVGLLLLTLRCLDALVDPWLGRLADRAHRPARMATLACAALLVGFAALFLLPAHMKAEPSSWLVIAALALALTHAGYSLAQIIHQAWGARLGGDSTFRARVVGSREIFALVGVVVASVAPSLWGWHATTLLLALLLVAGLVLLQGAPSRHVPAMPGDKRIDGLWQPWQSGEFRSLMLVYVLNGLASAIPATLVLFFIRDRLQMREHEGVFLLLYFVAAALSVPLWTRWVQRLGLVKLWAMGMVLAIAVFITAAWLRAGDGVWFALVCLGSGAALGADLVAPSALLAGAMQRTREIPKLEATRAAGVWFGWWNLAGKLNLALAAGLALPLVQALGYSSGQRDEASLHALVLVYAVVPCAIKALAMLCLLMQRRLRVDMAATTNPSWNNVRA